MPFLEKVGGLFGPAGLSPEDQRRLGQQSLLAAGLGILANNRGGNGMHAIGQGLLGGMSTAVQQGQLMASQQQEQQERDRQQKIRELAPKFAQPDGTFDFDGLVAGIAQIDPVAALPFFRASGMGGSPAELQTFEALVKQAGGDPELRQQAARVRLGLDPRASSAAASTVKWRGPDGREHLGIFDPRTMTIFDPNTQQTVDARTVQMSPADDAGAFPAQSSPAQATPLPARSAPTPQPAPLPAPSAPRPAPTPFGGGGFAGLTPEEEERRRALGKKRGEQESEAAPIPGSEADRKRQEEDRRRTDKLRLVTTNIDSTMSEIDRALGTIDWTTTGLVGSMAQSFPGTDAYHLKQLLTTIRANLGFDRLQSMRDASPTGGALGQVAVQELEALQSAVASLDQAQTGDQLMRALQKARDHYVRWRDAATGQAAARSPSEMTDDELLRALGGG